MHFRMGFMHFGPSFRAKLSTYVVTVYKCSQLQLGNGYLGNVRTRGTRLKIEMGTYKR